MKLKKNFPEISVVMSVKDNENTIGRCIESILEQSFANFEFLIVDDGSQDNTKLVIESYLYDKRIRFFKNKKTIGLTSNLINLIKLSKGDFIFRQDGDDISDIDRLNVQINYLRDGYDLVGTKSIIKIQNDKKTKFSFHTKYNFLLKKLLKTGNLFIHGSLAFKKNKYFLIGGYDEKFKYSQDYDLILRFNKSAKLKIINQNLYILYKSHSSISVTKKYNQIVYSIAAIIQNHFNLKLIIPKIMDDNINQDQFIYILINDMKLLHHKYVIYYLLIHLARVNEFDTIKKLSLIIKSKNISIFSFLLQFKIIKYFICLIV